MAKAGGRSNGQRRRTSTIALKLALFVNAAILIVAAATFHTSGHADVKEIEQAYELLSPLLGLGIASALFAVGPASRGNEFIRDSDPRGSWRVFAEEDLPPDRRGGPYRRFRSVNVVDLIREAQAHRGTPHQNSNPPLACHRRRRRKLPLWLH